MKSPGARRGPRSALSLRDAREAIFWRVERAEGSMGSGVQRTNFPEYALRSGRRTVSGCQP